jgi:hypothetical protein
MKTSSINRGAAKRPPRSGLVQRRIGSMFLATTGGSVERRTYCAAVEMKRRSLGSIGSWQPHMRRPRRRGQKFGLARAYKHSCHRLRLTARRLTDSVSELKLINERSSFNRSRSETHLGRRKQRHNSSHYAYSDLPLSSLQSKDAAPPGGFEISPLTASLVSSPPFSYNQPLTYGYR